MIVSRNDDTTVFAPKKKNKLVKVVSRNAGDPVAEQFTQPPQLKVFNISKGIAKPFGLESLTGKTGVPLKFNQEGSHAGSYLFNAPQSLIISPLSTPVYKETNMKQRETEEVNPPPSNYSYLKNLIIAPYEIQAWTQHVFSNIIKMSVIIGLFLLVAYLLFSTARRVEQNQVWVGMAKETAHQLGTPLSSLIAWLEYLKSKGLDPETAVEIEKDVKRLETITERFSKIGSVPN